MTANTATMATLGTLHGLLPGSTLVGDPATPLVRVHSDTRTLGAGDFFVALKGERFDAHDFLPQAKAAGAVAALATHGLAEAGLAGLLVPDTRTALGELAAGWRRGFDIPVIAITGSNGKTTVTQMVAAILRAWAGEAAHSTQGNFNNEIGLPLTLLALREGRHRCAVVELGMNHPGEIALLSRWAAPTVALVNNAQREHQEFMATVEAVARENGSVFASLAPGGTAVFPADDTYTPLWHGLAGAHPVLGFSDGAAGEVRSSGSWQEDHWLVGLDTPQGPARFKLHLAGAHNLRNAAAAAACAIAAGVPLQAVARGLEAFEPVKGRSQVRRIAPGGRAVTLVDDSYNANPDSVRAAIDMLAALPGPHWLLLGDMGEVGDQGPAFHAEVGAHAKARGIEQVWTAGELCRHAAQACPGARHFPTVAELLAALDRAPGLQQAASILVKGSRFMKMEQVVAALQSRAQASSDTAGGGHAA